MNFERELLPLLLIHKFNMVGVCFFFFVSGISLSYNLEHKKDYLKAFIRNKVVLLMIFALLTQVIGKILESIVLGQELSVDFGLVTGWNWYIYEMSVLYLIFYTVNKCVTQNILRELIFWMSALSICFITLFFYKNGSWGGWSGAWYYSTFSFPFGITVYYHFDNIQRKVRMHPFLSGLLFLLIAACSCISLAMPKDSVIGGIFLRNIMGCSLMMCLFLAAVCADVTRIPVISRMTALLTKFSTEIYLYQFCLLVIWANVYEQKGWRIDLSYVVAVTISTLILGYVMHFVDSRISGILKKA